MTRTQAIYTMSDYVFYRDNDIIPVYYCNRKEKIAIVALLMTGTLIRSTAEDDNIPRWCWDTNEEAALKCWNKAEKLLNSKKNIPSWYEELFYFIESEEVGSTSYDSKLLESGPISYRNGGDYFY